MVHLKRYRDHSKILERMRKMFEDNLQHYVKEHPGEYVLFETNGLEITETFYETKEELYRATAGYEGLFGPTFLIEKIPEKTHRFNENNMFFKSSDEYVDVCPNDGETKLVTVSSIMKNKEAYRETARCPDCGCLVSRRPSEERIRRYEELLRKSKEDMEKIKYKA